MIVLSNNSVVSNVLFKNKSEAQDPIHIPVHGSNPGRRNNVGTYPMSYHYKLLLMLKICLTDIQRPSLRSEGLGFDPCTWTWIESWQMQKSEHLSNELSLNINRKLKICLTHLERPSLGSEGLGLDPWTWTWIESQQKQKSVHFTNELS